MLRMRVGGNGNGSDASMILRKTKQIRGFRGFGFGGTHDGSKEIVNIN